MPNHTNYLHRMQRPKSSPVEKPEAEREEEQKKPDAPKKKAHFSMTWMLIILVLLAAAGFSIFYATVYLSLNKQLDDIRNETRTKNTPMPKPSVTPNTMVRWKTYINNNYEYTVKYPKEWIMIEAQKIATNSSEAYHLDGDELQKVSFVEPEDSKNPLTISQRDGRFTIMILPLKDAVRQSKPISSTTPGFPQVSDGVDYQSYSFYGNSMLSGKAAQKYSPLCCSAARDSITVVQNNNYMYRLSVPDLSLSIGGLSGPDDQSIREKEDILNQILSTFRFLQPTEPVTLTPTARTSPPLTCIPRPKCLDSAPRCMIPESTNMCPVPGK